MSGCKKVGRGRESRANEAKEEKIGNVEDRQKPTNRWGGGRAVSKRKDATTRNKSQNSSLSHLQLLHLFLANSLANSLSTPSFSFSLFVSSLSFSLPTLLLSVSRSRSPLPLSFSLSLIVSLSLPLRYYDAHERADAVGASEAAKSGDEKGDMEAQAEASKFIKETLAGEFGSGDATGRTADEEELKRIGTLAGQLGEKAMKIVAGICGAPSDAHFREAARQLTSESLAELRVGLAKMGM